MARIRSIKPEFWADYPTASGLSRDARLLYISLWNFADEHARLPGDPRYIKGHCFPYDDDLDADAIDALLEQLASVGNVVRYVVDGAPYLFLPHLAKHQRLEPDKVPSRLPEPRTDESVRGADESARDAESSETIVALQVAGGRLQVAGSRQQDEPPPPIAELKRALEERRLVARWDKLTAQEQLEILGLIEVNGQAALVASASREYQPNAPAAHAMAWLPGWRALPRPPRLRSVARCSVHQQLEPCIGCKADAKVGEA